MGLFKHKEKSGVKCPACGSSSISPVKGTKAVMAYPGFYSGVSSNAGDAKIIQMQCKECKNVFRIDS